jgi:hypothetical protein
MKVVFRILEAILLAKTNSVSEILLQFWGLDLIVYVQTIAITATCMCLFVASCLNNELHINTWEAQHSEAM